MKKLIETFFPLEDVNASSMEEKMTKGHPGNLHLWWGRTPVNSTAALLFAALADAPEEKAKKEEYDRLISGLAAGDEEACASAREILKDQKKPVVADPFCGYGGIPLAASELGLAVEAGDLNSVAVLLTKVASEIPPRFADRKAVHPGARIVEMPGSEALAEDVEYYGRRLEQLALEQLSELYPKAGGQDPMAWIWVRTAECPNPACRCRMPLASTFVLSKKKDREAWAEPVLENGRIIFRIRSGPCPEEKSSNKIKERGSAFRCPACGGLVSEDYIRRQGNAGDLGYQLMAVVMRAEEGKTYLEPDESQERAAEVPAPEDSPEGFIAENSRHFSPPLYGLREYRDLYTHRQLRMLCTLSDFLPRVQEEVAADALAAGIPEDSTPLNQGGAGSTAYSQAISVYLSLAISRMANRNSTICTWNNGSEAIRAALTRQMIPMTWTFVEMNPFSEETGSFQSMLRTVTDTISAFHGEGKVQVSQRNALNTEIPEGSLFCSELPYYDNTDYADLSDYFYVWLRRCLKDTYPELFREPETAKEELCSIPEHYGKDPVLAGNTYRSQISELCRNLSERVSAEYPSLLFFKYTEKDEKELRAGTGKEPCALESIMDSLYQAGLQITGLWPVRTEELDRKAASTRIVIVFRKPGERQPVITRRAWIGTMKRKLPEQCRMLSSGGVSPANGRMAALGFGLAIFTEYERVLNADGSEMSIRDVLHLVYQEAEEYWSNVAGETAATEKEEAGHAEEL